MSKDLLNLKYNESFTFRDGTAKFLSNDVKNRTAWVEYKGQLIKVDYNDLFGMNYADQMRQEVLSGIDERIEDAQKSYEEYCAKIEFAKFTSRKETENQNWLTLAMRKLLYGKKDKSELTGIKANQYNAYETLFRESTKVGDRASSDIFTYAIAAVDEAYYKHDLYCQRSLGEAMMG